MTSPATGAEIALMCTNPCFPWAALLLDHELQTRKPDAVIDQEDLSTTGKRPLQAGDAHKQSASDNSEDDARSLWVHAPYSLAAAAHPFARIGLRALLQTFSHDEGGHSTQTPTLNIDVLNTRDHEGKTPLFWAARAGRGLVVRDLLHLGAELDHCTRSASYTALMAAAAAGHADIVLTLVRAGACVHTRARGAGMTALYLVIESRSHAAVIEALLEAGANPNLKQTSTGDTPLHLSASRNDHETVSSLLCLGSADPTIANLQGYTALHIAAEGGFKNTVDTLLNGCHHTKRSLHCRDSKGRTALDIAIQGNHLAVIDLLLKAGAVDLPNEYFGDFYHDQDGGVLSVSNPLYVAATGNSPKVVKMLLRHGVDTSYREPRVGATALHGAACCGQPLAIQLLLTAGMRVDSRTVIGQWTPLHYAASRGRVEAVKVLLQGGAYCDAEGRGVIEEDEDVTNSETSSVTEDYPNELLDMSGGSRTPLHLAAIAGHAAVVSVLLKTSVNVDHNDSEGNSALALATAKCHSAVVEIILKRHIMQHCRDAALHEAAERGNCEIAQMLLRAGANIEARCREHHFTPLHVACRKTHEDLVKLLLHWGADEEALESELHPNVMYDPDAKMRYMEIGRNASRVIGQGMPPRAIRFWTKAPDDFDGLNSSGNDSVKQNAGQNDVDDAEEDEEHDDDDASNSDDGDSVVDVFVNCGLRVQARAEDDASDQNGLGDYGNADEAFDDEDVIDGEDEAERRRRTNVGATEKLYHILSNAPKERAWGRRGWLLMTVMFTCSLSLSGHGYRRDNQAKKRYPLGIKRDFKNSMKCRELKRVVGLLATLAVNEEGLFRHVVTYL